MFTECKHCGEFAVDDSENQEVCQSCGIVVGEINFSHTSSYVPPSRSTYVPYTKLQARFYKRKRDPLGLQHGISVLDNLCHMNNVSSHVKTQVTELFKLAVSVKRFKPKEDAGTTAACCLFLIQRKNKQAIALNTLCFQVPCTKGKFSFYLKFLKSCLSSNDKFKHYSFLLDNGAHEYPEAEPESDTSDVLASLIREVCYKAEKGEKAKLIEKTTALVDLANSCWLLTGRSPRSVVVASAYLCWMSMHHLRKKASYSKFCSTFEIREPMARLRIPELKELLLKLGKKIPSHSKNYVNESNLIFHLGTILEHSETLRYDLLPDVHTKEDIEAKEYSNFRNPPKNLPRKEPTDGVQYDPDMNASDIEISDSEIESYIIPESKKSFLIKSIKSESSVNKEPTDSVQYDSDMNASDIKKSDSQIESYILPESKKSFLIKSESSVNKEPTDSVQHDSDMNASDIEISDSQIESYILPESKKSFLIKSE